MGVAADLSYVLAPPTALHRAVRSAAATRAGAALLAHTLPTLDRAVSTLSRGRTTACALLSGLPVLVVTTTGRRTDRPRETRLIGVPVGGTLALLGTNFGQARTPAWVLNLEADPRATVAHRGAVVRVVAREADPAERVEVLDLAELVYVGFPRYLTRVPHRRVRILLLENAVDQPG
ncbi:nitroreductase family deazaflavin-dependent oxidoreductase [Phycicoccus sp. HDW14]|uniref:nitroreductase family deazaflavin-dependent oxidoreductase n=1 Tax=Phycicoccus sp. HDW14 TaxID=2714941 RepID=UPI0014087E4D|nr:nitroreductase family deazaflavin-dependent oxidoreductase [Phycicoccus sp. HDW14]QIM21240.1 nitroreductase family deazaflavin-dependent oxidoreductase [Phycicoccus sp. HDW14]